MQAKTCAVVTVDELAAYLTIPKSTLYKLAQEGKVSGQEVGPHCHFRSEAVDRGLDQTANQGHAPTKRGRK